MDSDARPTSTSWILPKAPHTPKTPFYSPVYLTWGGGARCPEQRRHQHQVVLVSKKRTGKDRLMPLRHLAHQHPRPPRHHHAHPHGLQGVEMRGVEAA
ncbi:hypothetical protein E2C01_038061 [Portunus trituberculatus]|uniref:Uncharacterized protein n=1 Tax=Portunus trituberculatus TaxID=210409 RepID=A0A5B7FHI2_PORTR|nr:hypothetical protein [Portunus trituberculatus]